MNKNIKSTELKFCIYDKFYFRNSIIIMNYNLLAPSLVHHTFDISEIKKKKYFTWEFRAKKIFEFNIFNNHFLKRN